MAAIGRLGIGTTTLLVGGLGLGALMVYILVGMEYPSRRGPHDQGALEVAVFFQDRSEWADFREGVAACVRTGLLKHVADADGAVITETPQAGHRLRFAWHPVRGIDETRSEVKRLAEREPPPIAVIGSGNTFWTMVLAEGLRDANGRGVAPVLLVPWATAVHAQPVEGRSGPVRLMEVYGGRTFRFCPDDRRQAGLLVRCLLDRESSSTPGRAIVVVDRTDPYSVDLAEGFREAIKAIAPGARIEETDDVVSTIAGPDMSHQAGVALWAGRIRDAAKEGTTWVVLPLQDAPALRLIAALRDYAGEAGGNLRVLCGDAMGLDDLMEISAQAPFPVWSVSPAAMPKPGAVGPDAQVMAEIVAALARAIDRDGEIDARVRLASLDISPGDAAAVAGRSLSFEPTGERRGEDLGHVLATRPGYAGVLAYERSGGGGCREVPLSLPATVGALR